jgi:hypothetical protein
MQSPRPVIIVLVVLALAAVGYLVYSSMQPTHTMVAKSVEHFSDNEAPADSVQLSMNNGVAAPTSTYNVDGSEAIGFNEQPQGVEQSGMGLDINQLPSECYPKNVLSSADLLPADANSLYAQVNPSGQGSLADQNFLTAGFHIGINTVGQTLRNANRQLRSEPLNPQVKVSPWMQTTIEPDINRKPLEIGGGDL